MCLSSISNRRRFKQLKTISEGKGFEKFTFVPSVPGIAENEFKQMERLQEEERLALMHEHEMEMDDVRQKFEQIAELNNRIERVRSDLI